MLSSLWTTGAWVERGSVTVKCLAQEHNIMSPPRIMLINQQMNRQKMKECQMKKKPDRKAKNSKITALENSLEGVRNNTSVTPLIVWSERKLTNLPFLGMENSLRIFSASPLIWKKMRMICTWSYEKGDSDRLFHSTTESPGFQKEGSTYL